MVNMRLFRIGIDRGTDLSRVNCRGFMDITMTTVMRHQRLVLAHFENNACRRVFGEQGTDGKIVANTRGGPRIG